MKNIKICKLITRLSTLIISIILMFASILNLTKTSNSKIVKVKSSSMLI